MLALASKEVKITLKCWPGYQFSADSDLIATLTTRISPAHQHPCTVCLLQATSDSDWTEDDDFDEDEDGSSDEEDQVILLSGDQVHLYGTSHGPQFCFVP